MRKNNSFFFYEKKLIFYRVKEIQKNPPYTQKEADAAAGLGTDNGVGRDQNASDFYASPVSEKNEAPSLMMVV